MLIANLRFSSIVHFVEHSSSEKFKSIHYNMKEKVTCVEREKSLKEFKM